MSGSIKHVLRRAAAAFLAVLLAGGIAETALAQTIFLGGGGSSLSTPVSVANGGTACSAASLTCVTNILGADILSPAIGGSGAANTGILGWNAAQTFSFTSGQTMTFPSTTATLARTDAGQTFTGTQVFGQITVTPAVSAPSGSSAAATGFNFGTANSGIYGSSSNIQFAIGGTQIGNFGAGGFTISSTEALILSNKAFIATAPTVTSGLGTSPTVTANGTAAFKVVVGTGSPTATEVLGFPAATNGWVCTAYDITTNANTAKQTAFGTTSVTLTWSGAPSVADVLVHQCTGV